MGMLCLQALDLGSKCGVIRIEEADLAFGDAFSARLGARLINGLAVEGGGGAELRRRLPGIERNAGRIPVDVDHGARDRGADHGCAETGGEIVEALDPPIGILAGEPW